MLRRNLRQLADAGTFSLRQRPARFPSSLPFARRSPTTSSVLYRTTLSAFVQQQQRNTFHTTSLIQNSKKQYSNDNAHRSDAEQRISEVPVIYVDADIAVCDGGGGAMGHPIEYIQLHNVRKGVPVACKYCGLRYAKKEH
eukprot:g3244.t1